MSSTAICYREACEADATVASQLVCESFLTLAARDWQKPAQDWFLAGSTPQMLTEKIATAAYTAAAFSGERMVGFLLMPNPAERGMLFVLPACLRQGIGRQLWERARSYLADRHADVAAVQLNTTPYAREFYCALGFMPLSEINRAGARATRMTCRL